MILQKRFWFPVRNRAMPGDASRVDRRGARGYHEALDAQRMPRPHWAHFLAHLETLSNDDWHRHQGFIDRQIQENGATFNLHADHNSGTRPWALDPLPLIIPADEWRRIASAIAQRATLMNAVLADLYGPQRLLAEGLLPAALVYGDPRFLFPCVGVPPADGTWLHVYAADLARSPDGRWWVTADRTQTPSGMGFALENRQIISRLFPEMYHELNVRPLNSFFHDLQDSLTRQAKPARGEQPHIVMLTAGQHDDSYFEHVYLARLLGFPLVEGQDLTVRGEEVFLRTLQGLKRVHVIVRRQFDALCDPLALRGDSVQGIPGLLNAVRAGRVVMANALGSGITGGAALHGFWPAICEKLLGEPLAMPSVATWWCGEKPAYDFVCEHFSSLTIKSAGPEKNFIPVRGSECDPATRAHILACMAACPQAFIGQEYIELAHTPARRPGSGSLLRTRPVDLQVYAVATGSGYHVMPGGLTRVAADGSSTGRPMQHGIAKDTWVGSDLPIANVRLLKPRPDPADLVHSGANLTSRVVENLFWFGRYSERVDGRARLLRIVLTRRLEAGAVLQPEEAALTLARQLHMLGDAPVGLPCLLQALRDDSLPGSLACAIQKQVSTASHVRERWALDHWLVLKGVLHDLASIQRPHLSPDAALDFLNSVIRATSSLAGFAMDNMTRDDGWRFLTTGRHIERLEFLGSAIAGFLKQESKRGENSLEWLLELSDSIITYRSRYSRTPEFLPVLDLLVRDISNPRGIGFQIEALLNHLAPLSAYTGEPLDGSLREALQSIQALDYARFSSVDFSRRQSCLANIELANHLETAVCAARTLSDRLDRHFFTHTSDRSRSVWTA